MAGPARRRRRVAWVAPGDGGDHITALPLELRARIASFLPFRQVAQLATLSRSWRHIHHHAPVVELNLHDWGSAAAGVLNEDALAGLEVAPARRGREGSASKVETLSITHGIDDPRVRRNAGLVVALAVARTIRVTVPRVRRSALDEWAVDLSPAARDLEVDAFWRLAPTVAGPGAAALRTLCLDRAVIDDWPCLPSLRGLALNNVSVRAPCPPGAWCPRLECLCILASLIRVAHLDIRLPLLRRLMMEDVHTCPPGGITVDAPELQDLHVYRTPGLPSVSSYKSFTLRAPRLRYLNWAEQSAERVNFDVGKRGSVTSGRIRFTWDGGFVGCPEMKDFRAKMMRMLQGLLRELPPERVADAARPYMSHDKYTVEYPDTRHPGEMLTCDLDGLMSSPNV